jgi:hypothetical protein
MASMLFVRCSVRRRMAKMKIQRSGSVWSFFLEMLDPQSFKSRNALLGRQRSSFGLRLCLLQLLAHSCGRLPLRLDTKSPHTVYLMEERNGQFVNSAQLSTKYLLL